MVSVNWIGMRNVLVIRQSPCLTIQGMTKYQKIKRKKVDRDPRLVKSIDKKGDYRGARRSSWWNETSSTVDQVMSLNKALSPWPPH